uniref:Serine aminopeptidase S33 domain-containing protein n=1 Tax=Arundo donax TaxID=35708 RepID=A0A0A9DEJ4_ARUDO
MPPEKSAQSPVHREQRVIISNKHGERLVGLLHQTGSKKLVILCHGFRATKASPYRHTVSRKLIHLSTLGIEFSCYDSCVYCLFAYLCCCSINIS